MYPNLDHPEPRLVERMGSGYYEKMYKINVTQLQLVDLTIYAG